MRSSLVPFFESMFIGPLVPSPTMVTLMGTWLESKRLERKEVKGLSVRGSKRCVEYESGSSMVEHSGVMLSAFSYRDTSDSVSDVGDVGSRKVLPSQDVILPSVRSR